MKKFSIMLLGALTLAAFSACDEAPAVPPMQSNPQEPVLTTGDIAAQVQGVLSTPATVIDLQQYVDNSLINVVEQQSVKNLPEGAQVKYYMELSPSADFGGQVETLDIEFIDSNIGYVDAQRWSNAQIAIFGKNPEKVRDVYYRIPVYVQLDGTEYRYESDTYYVGSGMLKVRCIDTGFMIYPEYYLLGNATTWDLNEASAFKFRHSDADPYDDPVFTYIVEVGADCYWKIASSHTLETADWSTVYGPADDGDENLVGKLFEGGQAGKIAEAGKYLFTINMETLDYTIEPFNRPEYLCTPGNSNGWKQTASNWMHYFESNDASYFYGALVLDGIFKLTDGDTWDNDKTWGLDANKGEGFLAQPGDNIPVPQKGLYWAKVDLVAKTYSLTLVESLGVIGGGNWDVQRNLTPNADFTIWEGDMTIDGDWKLRINDNWDYNFGGELAAPEYNGANFPAGPGACHVVVSFAGNWPVIDVQPL